MSPEPGFPPRCRLCSGEAAAECLMSPSLFTLSHLHSLSPILSLLLMARVKNVALRNEQLFLGCLLSGCHFVSGNTDTFSKRLELMCQPETVS